MFGTMSKMKTYYFKIYRINKEGIDPLFSKDTSYVRKYIATTRQLKKYSNDF